MLQRQMVRHNVPNTDKSPGSSAGSSSGDVNNLKQRSLSRHNEANISSIRLVS